MNILISACLLGCNTRYDGGGKVIPELSELMEHHTLIPICPEQLGGMSTPRLPSERIGGRVINNAGQDVTDYFENGAREALKLAKLYNCQAAILKERSPSCGSGVIYDGSFSGQFKPGNGVTGELFKNSGIEVFGESRIQELIEKLREEQVK